MEAITFATAHANFAPTIERVCAEHQPVIITRGCAPAVVLISLDDYNSLDETAHLLRSPANASRLLDAIDSLENGHGIEREIID